MGGSGEDIPMIKSVLYSIGMEYQEKEKIPFTYLEGPFYKQSCNEMVVEQGCNKPSRIVTGCQKTI